MACCAHQAHERPLLHKVRRKMLHAHACARVQHRMAAPTPALAPATQQAAALLLQAYLHARHAPRTHAVQPERPLLCSASAVVLCTASTPHCLECGGGALLYRVVDQAHAEADIQDVAAVLANEVRVRQHEGLLPRHHDRLAIAVQHLVILKGEGLLQVVGALCILRLRRRARSVAVTQEALRRARPAEQQIGRLQASGAAQGERTPCRNNVA